MNDCLVFYISFVKHIIMHVYPSKIPSKETFEKIKLDAWTTDNRVIISFLFFMDYPISFLPVSNN